MPPKVKITKQEIIQTAVELIRSQGENAMNARAIASALQCSTQPIFSNFATMEDVHGEVVAAAYDLYLEFLRREAESGAYPQYKAFGMAYIRFAKEERELFKFLFMRDHQGQGVVPTVDFEASIQIIMRVCGLTEDKARRMHLEMWTCVHGIGTMLATSFVMLDWELISDMLTDVYQGLVYKHRSEEMS